MKSTSTEFDNNLSNKILEVTIRVDSQAKIRSHNEAHNHNQNV